MSKEAKARYAELQEQQRLAEISIKAQEYHKREARALKAVRRKAADHDERKMKLVVRKGDAKRLGDKILLTKKVVPAKVPSTYRAVVGMVQVEEATVTEDQFMDMLDERHTLIDEGTKQTYQRKHHVVQKSHPETVTIDPKDALHFMTTGKIPVRTRAELKEIVEMGGLEIDEVGVVSGDDAAALLYFSGRNHRK
jgi:hypothetical protein